MTLTEIRHALGVLEAKPRQSLGQNFLQDENIAKWIVAQLGAKPGDHLVEIGPGLGALTQWLAATGNPLSLVEKDRTMVTWLRDKFAQPNVELFHEDALEFDLRRLYGKGPVKVISNLPYYVSTPLIAKMTSALSPASILVVTVQHEVAMRLCAQPGTKDFGAMSVCCSRRWNVRYAKKLPPDIFFPAPKISSAVVVFTRKTAAELPPCNELLLERLVRRGFSERRKQLRKLLPEYRERWSELCAHLSVLETVRAEELPLPQWERLAQWVGPTEAQSGEELFNVVNELDEVIDVQPRKIVHVNNFPHRAVHMLIFNQKGDLYLQKRSIWKDRNAGLWDSSAAGHVDAGETYQEAAERELREEIGISCPLESFGRLACTEETGWEFIELFRGQNEGRFKPAPMEIDAATFFSLEQIRQWARTTPGDFSPVFLQILPLL